MRMRGQFYIMMALFFIVSVVTLIVLSKIVMPRVVYSSRLIADEIVLLNYKASAAAVTFKYIVAGVNCKVFVDPNTGKPVFDKYEWDEWYLWENYTTTPLILRWDYGTPPPSLNTSGFIVFKYATASLGFTINFTFLSDPLFEYPSKDQQFIVALDFAKRSVPGKYDHSGYAFLVNRTNIYIYTFSLSDVGWDEINANPRILLQNFYYALSPPPSYKDPAYSNERLVYFVYYEAGGTLVIQEAYGYRRQYMLTPPDPDYDGARVALFINQTYVTASLDSIVLRFAADVIEDVFRNSIEVSSKSSLLNPSFSIKAESLSVNDIQSLGTIKVNISSTPFKVDEGTEYYSADVYGASAYLYWTSSIQAFRKGTSLTVSKTYNFSVIVPTRETVVYKTGALTYFYVIKLPVRIELDETPVCYASYYAYMHFKILSFESTDLLPYVSFIERLPVTEEKIWYILHVSVPEDAVHNKKPLLLVISLPEGPSIWLRLIVGQE